MRARALAGKVICNKLDKGKHESTVNKDEVERFL